LRDVPLELFTQHGHLLEPPLRRRAAHFCGELERVRRGVAAWRAGDLAAFGALMAASGWSSINNYECGAPELVALYEVLVGSDGVYGARFSGAGFRGFCLALVDPERAGAIAARVRTAYLARFPQHVAAFRFLEPAVAAVRPAVFR